MNEVNEGVGNTMKSVKDISLMLKVSNTTIYNHISKLGDDLEPYKKIIDRTTYIKDEGIHLIKISMGLVQPPKVKESVSMENIIDDISNQVTNNMKLENQLLNEKLDLLTELVKELQEDRDPRKWYQKLWNKKDD